jgi:hypothetical protein
MNARDALKRSIEMGRTIALGYIEDLTDDELMKRPHPDCNHIKWQLGHLICGEHALVDKVVPGSMPALPPGFADRYGRESARSNDPAAFDTKAELLKVFEAQRTGTLAALARVSDADLDRQTGIEYAPTVGAVFELQGSHWVMHAGQWAVIRRQLGRPPLY